MTSDEMRLDGEPLHDENPWPISHVDWPKTAFSYRAHTVRSVELEPWLLGWCKWYIVVHSGDGARGARDSLASGRWRWRGLKAAYHERVFYVQGDGVIDGRAFAGQAAA